MILNRSRLLISAVFLGLCLTQAINLVAGCHRLKDYEYTCKEQYCMERLILKMCDSDTAYSKICEDFPGTPRTCCSKTIYQGKYTTACPATPIPAAQSTNGEIAYVRTCNDQWVAVSVPPRRSTTYGHR